MTKGTCSIESCGTPVLCRGWCSKHYARWRATGDPLGIKGPARYKLNHGDGTKTCLHCERRLPLSEYNKAARLRDGIQYICRDCAKARHAAYGPRRRASGVSAERLAARRDYDVKRRETEQGKQARRESDRKHYEANRQAEIERSIEKLHRRRATTVGSAADVGITVDELRVRLGDACHYCRQPMIFARGRTYVPLKATLEHVVPISAGGSHTWDNVVLACWRCNLSKGPRLLENWTSRIAG